MHLNILSNISVGFATNRGNLIIMKNLLILFLLPVFQLNAQSLNELFNQSAHAYESNNYTEFLALTQKLDSIRPMHPKISYNLAKAYALNNDMTHCYTILKRIALMDNTVDVATDETFSIFRETAHYEQWKKDREEISKMASQSEKMVMLDEKDLHPEGLCYVEGTGWLATSVHKRKIVKFDIKTGKCSDWMAEKDMLAVFSIQPDKQNKYLWAATSAIPEMAGYATGQEGMAEVLKIDISSGKIVKRFPLTGGHLFGDLLVSGSGDVFVSDSGTPIIYKITGDSISEWLDLRNEAFSLQGITIDEKSQTLYIGDYLKGILAVSLKNKSHHWLELSCVKGIDGLTYHEGSLFAIHNGVTPIRIMKYQLMKDSRNVMEHILDNNRPEFNEPVLGTFYNGGFYFFANAPWKAYDRNGSLVGSFSNPELYRWLSE